MKGKIAILLSVLTLALSVPAMSGCKAGLEFKLIEKDGESYYSVGVSGSKSALKGDIVIPATYGEDNLPVREIPAEAFRNSSISSVTIPASVKVAGNACFANCNMLTSVTIEDGGLTEISRGMFGYDGALKSVNIPDSVQYIRPLAFSNCVGLRNITLSENLLTIEYSAFYECESLESIDLPDTLTTIGDMAFTVSGLKELTIPDSVTDTVETVDGKNVTVYGIGVGAFLMCTSLKKVVIGGGVQTIPMGSFCNCTALEEIYLPKSLKTIGGFGQAYGFNMPHPFYYDTKLADVYYAGTAEDWALIDIDKTETYVNGEACSNKNLLDAKKHYAE